MSDLSTVDFVKQIIRELEENDRRWQRAVSWGELEDYLDSNDIIFEEVLTEFHEGGRWTNYYERVIKIDDDYVQISESVPASETNESGEEGIDDVISVQPKQITKTIYVAKLEG